MVMAYVEALTMTDVEFGGLLWKELRGDKTFPANGALWLFDRKPGEWHLLIATPRVDQVGARKAYEELANVTRRVSADSTQLLRIELISPKQPLYQALRSVFGNTASVEGARLGNTQIGGMYIDDAYLYEIQ